MQMGLERMMTALMPIMAGAESVSGMGDGWDGASSLEMMVIDNKIYNDIARITRGSAVDDDRLGLDNIDNPGIMSSFAEQIHTTDPLWGGERMIDAHWNTRASEKTSTDRSKPLLEAARERMKTILKEHSPMPLDKDIEKDIRWILKDAQKSLVG